MRNKHFMDRKVLTFNDLNIKRVNDEMIVISYDNLIVRLYKNTFNNSQTMYDLIIDNYSIEFLELIFRNIDKIGITLDYNSKKYFINTHEIVNIEDLNIIENLLSNIGYICSSSFDVYCISPNRL